MLGFIYSVVSYVAFLVVFPYFALFSDGIGVPKHVDSAPSSHGTTAVLVNLALLLLFGVQHSVMARASFKRLVTRVIPAHLERATYVLASAAAMALLIWQWQALPGVLWSTQSAPVAALLWAINALGWLGVPATSFMIDHFDLFGLKQAFSGFRRVSFQRKGFVTPVLYKYVRHPMMTSVLVALWVTPHMTLGHLLLSVGMTIYIVIGVHFEERALVEELGIAYTRYQASTPKFLPTGRTDAPAESASSSPPAREPV